MTNKKTILMTGGGSAGHVTPNIALLPGLIKAGYDIHYIGTADSIEERLIREQRSVTYHTIEAGKLRRYFSLKNLSDPFRVVKGISQARRIIKTVQPDVVFSKGGFVSVPVVMAARKKCPVICHESDFTPGLANKLASRFADMVLTTFEDTLRCTSNKNAVHTGTPIRRELYSGNRTRGLDFLGFDGKKPVILVMGGSLGASALNDGLRTALKGLINDFDIVHLTGKGKLDESIRLSGYRQYEYITTELPDVFAATDLVVSRSGANALFEFLALNKPALFVPLPLEASRGDQILNAEYAVKKGYSMMLAQKDLTPETLEKNVRELYARRSELAERMKSDGTLDGTARVIELIESTVARRRLDSSPN